MPTPTTSRRRPTSKVPSRGTPHRGGSDSALPQEVYAPRLKRVIQAVKNALGGPGWMLVTSPADVAYITGFLGGDSFLLLPGHGRGKPVLISDFRYREELAPQRRMFEVRIRTGSIWIAVAEELAKRRIKVCGFQAEHMTVADRTTFDGHAGPVGARTRETKGVLSELRKVKDAHEVGLIRGAIKIQEAALLSVLPMIKPGVSELEVAAALEAEMKRRGSSAPAFESIVGANANGSLPHYRPGRDTITAGKPLLIDWGAVNRGYRGDMTRTFHVGKWSAKMREIYDVVLEAHERAAAALRAGETTRWIDTVARRYITKKGYGKQFGHGLGHGLGLHTHEKPSLHHLEALSEPLRAGMVVTIEPGIYLPGVGGVRIEDNYLVTETGSQNLSSLPKDRTWATLSA